MGFNATIFLPPGPVTTIIWRPLACRDAAKLGGTTICRTTEYPGDTLSSLPFSFVVF
jgi:hypothetical protein